MTSFPTDWGLNDNWRSMAGNAGQTNRVPLAASYGATVLRCPLYWGAVEAVQGTRNWSTPGYQAVYDQAAANGMKVLWCLNNCPSWADDSARYSPAGAVQTLNYQTAVPTSFTLTWNGLTTGTLTPANAVTASQVLTALNALTAFPAGAAVYGKADSTAGSFIVTVPGGTTTITGTVTSGSGSIASGTRSQVGRAYLPNSGHLSNLTTLITDLVTRFPNSYGVEVWNEPNTDAFGAPVPDGTAYAAVQQTVYDAVKAQTASVKVLSAGLAPVAQTFNKLNRSPTSFLADVFAAGGGSTLDLVAAHLYPANGYLATAGATDPAPQFTEYVTALATASVSKSISVTEYGYQTLVGSNAALLSVAGQAAALRTYIPYFKAQSVPLLIIHRLIDDSSFDDGYGLYDKNGPGRVADAQIVVQQAALTPSPPRTFTAVRHP